MSSSVKSWMPTKGLAPKYHKLVVCMNSGISFFTCKHGLLEKKVVVGKRERLLLGALIETPGSAISNEELMQKVWLGRPVSGNALAVKVHNLRHILRGVGREQDIQRLTNNGYRFKHEDSKSDYRGSEIVIYANR